MNRNLNYKPGKQPIYDFVRKILKLFFRKPEIVNYNESLEDKAIFLSTHCAKLGPSYLDLYFPKKHAIWGAHEMLGTYKERYKYLRNVYYIQKMKKSKFRATISAAFEAIFNIFFYKGMHVLPTYPDIRLTKTIKASCNVLDNNLPIMIFPENSNDGYFDVLNELFPGFILLSDAYYKKNKIDLPVYPVYLHYKQRKLFIDKPLYIQKLKEEGLDNSAICEMFKEKINHFFYEYIKK